MWGQGLHQPAQPHRLLGGEDVLLGCVLVGARPVALMPLIPKEKWIVFSHQLIDHGRGLCTARDAEMPDLFFAALLRLRESSGRRAERKMNETTADSPPLVEIKNLFKSYYRGSQQIPVLQDLTLSIPEGEFMAMMGPSGSGKTTLLNLIARY